MFDIIRSFIHPSIHIRILFEINRTLCSPCVYMCLCVFVACACTSSHPSVYPSTKMWAENELSHTLSHYHWIDIYLYCRIYFEFVNFVWMSCERMPQWASNSLFNQQKAAHTHKHTHRERKFVFQGRHTIYTLRDRHTNVIALSRILLSNEWICETSVVLVCVPLLNR